MSLIASFYLLPAALGDRLAAVLAAPAPRPSRSWNPFKRAPLPPDPVLAFLDAHARELADFPYNGDVLVDLGLLVPAVFDGGAALGERLSALQDSTWVAFTPALADRMIRLLRAADLSQAAIDAALREEGRDAVPDYAMALRDGADCVVRWLEQVGGEDVGLLWVG